MSIGGVASYDRKSRVSTQRFRFLQKSVGESFLSVRLFHEQKRHLLNKRIFTKIFRTVNKTLPRTLFVPLNTSKGRELS